MPHSEFGTKLRHLIESGGLSITNVAFFAGMQRTHLHHLLAGAKEPSWSTVCKLADALGVSTDEFREHAGVPQ